MNDLTKHFIAGAVISSIVCVVTLLILGTDKTASDWAIGFAFFAALAAGLAKEWYDKKKGGRPDPADVTATWFGAVVPMVIWGIIQNYV
jgi:ABC-type Mn2+/Zn2+ transport system permease subunit